MWASRPRGRHAQRDGASRLVPDHAAGRLGGQHRERAGVDQARLAQVAGAGGAARLLVADEVQDDPAAVEQAELARGGGAVEHRDEAALHVGRPAPDDPPVAPLRLELRRALRRDDVEVPVEVDEPRRRRPRCRGRSPAARSARARSPAARARRAAERAQRPSSRPGGFSVGMRTSASRSAAISSARSSSQAWTSVMARHRVRWARSRSAKNSSTLGVFGVRVALGADLQVVEQRHRTPASRSRPRRAPP